MVVQMSYVYAVHNYLLHDSIDYLVAFHAKNIYDHSNTIAKLDVIAIICNPLYLTTTVFIHIPCHCVYSLDV